MDERDGKVDGGRESMINWVVFPRPNTYVGVLTPSTYEYACI